CISCFDVFDDLNPHGGYGVNDWRNFQNSNESLPCIIFPRGGSDRDLNPRQVILLILDSVQLIPSPPNGFFQRQRPLLASCELCHES
ncbi:MAG: hypothetical protein ACREE6_06755, partial [Limisphaerales bacterium]